MRKRKKSGFSSNRSVRTAKKFEVPQLEWWWLNVEGACRKLVTAYRLYWLYEHIKPLIEQYLLFS